VRRLLDRGTAYRIDGDICFDIAAAAASSPWHLGQESNLDRPTMLELFAERGGDPERPGKRDALDPLLWRGPRAGEPSWETVLGAGRPGWHIECSVIAQEFLDLPLTVNGGGSDLVFPHHEFSAGHTAALTGRPLANLYSHTGLVAYRGEKMSKSLGNLVLVSTLVGSGVDARAIRLAVLSQRYRDDWEWTDDLLAEAQERLARWTAWASSGHSAGATSIREGMRVALMHDLDTPTALAAVDAPAARGPAPADGDLAAIDALLGIRL
jgi:L-cysteine:1D-myo-inositol 2-amino-2-deoxy-alpha-D-glucopyranoside ligase